MAIIEAKLYGPTYTIYLTSQSDPPHDGCREWMGQVFEKGFEHPIYRTYFSIDRVRWDGLTIEKMLDMLERTVKTEVFGYE